MRTGQQAAGTRAGQRPPVLDTVALRILAEQAGQSVADRFFSEYLDLLPARSANIVAGVAAEDLEKTLDAVVSLKVTSAMVGALQMEDCARTLERRLQIGHWPSSETASSVLSNELARIVSEARNQQRVR